MCIFNKPSIPTVTAPTPAPAAATESSSEVVAAREKERRRAMTSEGMKSTMLTGALGDTSTASTGQKALLGA